MNQKKAKRRSIRLRDYDYSQMGAYFTTICTQNGQCLFGNINNGKMLLNNAGEMVDACWKSIPDRFSFAELDEFVVMPDHLHGILVLKEKVSSSETHDTYRRGEPCVRPNTTPCKNASYPENLSCGTKDRSLGRIIQAFKSISARAYILGIREQKWTPVNSRLWQRGYYDHVVRNADQLSRIREYIVNNPARWYFDRANPEFNSLSGVKH